MNSNVIKQFVSIDTVHIISSVIQGELLVSQHNLIENNIKLSLIQLLKFSGDYTKWLEFKEILGPTTVW